MKKNIVIGLLIVVTLLSLMYAFVQKKEADKQRELAVEQYEIAQKNYDEMQRQRIVAEEHAKRLEEQMRLTESNSEKTK